MTTETPMSAKDFVDWPKLVAPYTKPDRKKSVLQVVDSFSGFFLTWIAMYFAYVHVGYWLTLLLAVLAAGFLVRIFIIQHDCGHGSFFKSKKAADTIGFICGVLTLTPYKHWRKSHAIHHAHHAELEERGVGDVWTLTIEEYQELSGTMKVVYRVFRNPFFLFFLAAPFHFLVLNRIPLGSKVGEVDGEFRSLWYTNLAIAVWVAVASYFIGFWTVLAISVPIMLIASAAGTWLFYVQHQFERTYWEHTPEWSYVLAAMQGSSYYKLPRVLQYFTGNIGFHHIHHLSPRIPNYLLERCHNENPIFQRVATLGIRESFATASLVLWDEDNRRLVSFREAFATAPRTAREAAKAAARSAAERAGRAAESKKAAAKAAASKAARAAEAKKAAAARAAAPIVAKAHAAAETQKAAAAAAAAAAKPIVDSATARSKPAPGTAQ